MQLKIRTKVQILKPPLEEKCNSSKEIYLF